MATTTRARETHDAPFWRALADPSRRTLLDLLRRRAMTMAEICEHFTISRFGVRKHLRVLEAAELVVVQREGRERFHYLNPVVIERVLRRWVRPFEAAHAAALLRLQSIAERS